MTFTPSYIRSRLNLHIFMTIISIGFWWLYALPYWYLFKQNEKLIITDTEVQYEKGIFSKEIKEIDLQDVRSIKVNQGTIGRLMGLGDIEISSSSGVDDQIVVKGIGSPNKIRDMLRHARKE